MTFAPERITSFTRCPHCGEHFQTDLKVFFEGIMTGLTDLQAAVAALTAEVSALTTYVQGIPAAILALQGSSDSDAAIETLAQQVQAQVAAMTSAVTAAQAALPEAPAASPPAASAPAPSGT